jgi:hypothetical protein
MNIPEIRYAGAVLKGWKAADEETYKVIQNLESSLRDWFRSEDLLDLPCPALRTIDSLWMEHSQGRFGFSVQKIIYNSCRIMLVREDPDFENDDRIISERFADYVGWRKDGRWLEDSELEFSSDSPVGSLPWKSSREILNPLLVRPTIVKPISPYG